MIKEEAGAQEEERERMHEKGGSRKTEEGQARAGLIHANTRSPAPGGKYWY